MPWRTRRCTGGAEGAGTTGGGGAARRSSDFTRARLADPGPSIFAQAEVVEHERGDVLDRPLRALGRSALAPRRLDAAREHDAQRVVAVERPVAASADVVGAAPVDELVTGSRRAQHVAGLAAGERGPQPPQGVGVSAALETRIVDRQPEHTEVALDAPGAATRVGQLSSRREPQLAVGARD